MRRPRLSLDAYEAGVLAGERSVLAQAVTLVESRNADDGALAQLKKAIKGGFSKDVARTQLATERLAAPVRSDPRFRAAVS